MLRFAVLVDGSGYRAVACKANYVLWPTDVLLPSACAILALETAESEISPKRSFKLNNLKSIPSVAGYLQCRWLSFPFRYWRRHWMSRY